MSILNSAPSAAQAALYTDACGKVLEGAYTLLGLGLPGETTTLAALENAAQTTIMGDGTSGNPGLGQPAWQGLIAGALTSATTGARYDSLFARQGQLMRVLDDLVQSALPDGWQFGAPRAFDGHLTRLNGAMGAPATPPAAGALTAVQSAAGALPTTTSGLAPRVVHTLVGSTDELESLPTTEAVQVAITGVNNSYTYQIAGTVPAGIYKVRLYRSLFGSSGAPYGWDQDVAVTAGAAYPAISIVQQDSLLRMDWQPPVWMQCGLRASSAALFALAYSASSTAGGPISFNPTGMLSPGNILLGPANGYIGIGNPVQSALFGESTLTALNTSTFTAGGIQTVNSAAQNLQGFCGAAGLRARCTAALNGTLTPTITITYYNAAHGWGSAQTASGLTPSTGFSTGVVGDTAVFTIPAGDIVEAITETAVSGTATAGSWEYEGVFPRS